MCKRYNIKPFGLAKFGMPLPPLPFVAPPLLTERDAFAKSAESVASKISSRASSGGKKRPSVSIAGSGANLAGSNTNVAQDTSTSSSNVRASPKRAGSAKGEERRKSDVRASKTIPVSNSQQIAAYTSRYKFTPTIDVETGENDEEDEIYKLEIRGWKVSPQIMEIMSIITPACSSITHLTFWNCGLTLVHYNHLANLLASSNVNHVTIDQNATVPETFMNTVLSDEAGIKSLTLRGNLISDPLVKVIGNLLKSNHTLVNLDLFDNKIGKDGAESLAEALRVNTTLQTLDLGRNHIGNDGAVALAKALSNYPLSADELQTRRKQIAELDRLKHEVEDDNTGGPKKKGARVARVTSAKADDKKEDPKKRGSKMPTKKELPTARPIKTPEDAKKKPVDDKKGKDKKAAVAAAKPLPKKGKPEEAAKEETEEANDNVVTGEPMFEMNNQWFILGNRTLFSLNLMQTGISEIGLRALYETVTEQEASTDQTPEGVIGLIRIVLTFNLFEADSLLHVQLQTLLNTRNPFFEDAAHDGQDNLLDQNDDNDSNPDDVPQ